MYASRQGEIEIVKTLHKLGADLNITSLYSGPAIFYAMESFNKKTLKYLIHNGANINLKNRYNISILVKAVEQNELNIIRCLLEHGAEDIDNALRTAVLSNNPQAFMLLEKKGGNINQINDNGESLIVEAINNKNWEIVEILFNKGANIISSKKFYGWEILNSAAQAGKLKLAKNIIEITKN